MNLKVGSVYLFESPKSKELILLNRISLRYSHFKIIASDYQHAVNVDEEDLMVYNLDIRLKNMKVIPVEDFPLYVGFPYVSDVFTSMLNGASKHVPAM